MKIIYTNLSPINNAYTNLNHLFYLKKQSPQKVYICIWDSFVYESSLFEKGNANKSKNEKLQENLEKVEKILTHLKIDYKIIFLSEAMNRLFKSSNHYLQFQTLLSNFNVEQLKKGFELNYIPFGNITLSRLNYIIADYLIATYLPEIYPELCSSQPTNYLTSERFKVFQTEIDHTLKNNYSKFVPPKTIYVTNVPVIIHPEERIIPSLEMSAESIKRIVSAYYTKKPTNKEIIDISEVILSVLPFLSYKDKNYSKSELNELTRLQKNELTEFVSQNLYKYFEEINKITAEVAIQKQKKSHYITTFRDYKDFIRQMTDIKLEILKHCNGNNSSLDISKLTGLKLSTVSTYMTHLKDSRVIENAKKPKRLIDSFVIDLEALEK
jgi:predicted transcriptional regulator